MIHLLKREQVATPVYNDLQELLIELLKYGQPRLGVYSSSRKWSCTVEMNTNTPGTNFDIKSEFGVHDTPFAAAKECHERIINALKAITK